MNAEKEAAAIVRRVENMSLGYGVRIGLDAARAQVRRGETIACKALHRELKHDGSWHACRAKECRDARDARHPL